MSGSQPAVFKYLDRRIVCKIVRSDNHCAANETESPFSLVVINIKGRNWVNLCRAWNFTIKVKLFYIQIRCSLPTKSRKCEADKKLFLRGYSMYSGTF